MQRERALAVVRPEARVARGEGEAVGLAHGRDGRDPDRQVEVAHHAADHDDLLRVLLAEVRDVGRDDVEQLADDGADAVEVRRAALGALQHGAEAGRPRTEVAKPAG